MPLTVRRRRPRFTVEELKALVGAVEKVRPVLFGPKASHNVLNSEVKDRTWTEISKVVNAVSQVKRSPLEIRKKWADWTSVVRKKSVEMEQRLAEHQGTEVCSSKYITPTERKLLAILETKPGLAEGSCKSEDKPDVVKQEVDSVSVDNSTLEESLGFVDNEDFSSTKSTSPDLWQAREKVHQVQYKTSTRFQNISSPQPTNVVPSQVYNPGDNYHDETAVATFQNGMNSGWGEFQNGVNSGPLKMNRIIKHPDVLLTLKKKKLKVLEEQVKIQRERLEVERGILQILKEIRDKHSSDLL